MYPEDRILVVYVPTPTDFARIQQQGWYRIPQRHAPKGLFAEYYAFYFGRAFGKQKWAIHSYAPRLGHELVTRNDLIPTQPHHPRAEQWYYKVQLGPITPLAQPITSLHWRRITFLHTTWDRLHDAVEINDLLLDGEMYVDRQYATLREPGGETYRIPTPCPVGEVGLITYSGNGRFLPQNPVRHNDIKVSYK
jgi:hypothetical protein